VTTIAGHLASRLREAGVRHVFGIPGGEVLAVLDACDQAGLAFHLVKHETSGGFIAEAVAQLTGTPGVLIGTLGPGVTNLVTAVADAYLDRTPMVVVTACADAGIDASYTHQLLDQSGLLKAVTKGSFTLSPTGAAPLIDRAIGLVTEGIPGPVHLNLPTRIATADVGGGGRIAAAPRSRCPPFGGRSRDSWTLARRRRAPLDPGWTRSPPSPGS
jgi:acetolactate synthase-1/2/3 large subunit